MTIGLTQCVRDTFQKKARDTFTICWLMMLSFSGDTFLLIPRGNSFSTNSQYFILGPLMILTSSHSNLNENLPSSLFHCSIDVAPLPLLTF